MIKKRLCIFLLLELLLISILTGCRTAEDYTDPSFKNFDVEYTINDDGTYTCSDQTYEHKVEVSGIEGELPVTFVVLTNNTYLTFEEVSYSLKRADITTDVPEFVILGWYDEISEERESTHN